MNFFAEQESSIRYILFAQTLKHINTHFQSNNVLEEKNSWQTWPGQ